MKTPLKKDSRTTFNFFPDELLQEARKVLGEEFIRLPKHIQTGYIIVLHNHHNIIKSNQHSRDTDSFFIEGDELESYFTDRRNFRAVNDNGYYLRPKKTRHGEIDGKYVLSRKSEEGANYYEPTNWLISTVKASQHGGEDKSGWSNGFQLSSKFRQLFDSWNKEQENSKVQLTLINNKDKTIEEVSQDIGGAIDRRLSTTESSININTEVRINTTILAKHKEELLTIKKRVEGKEGEEAKKEARRIRKEERRREKRKREVEEEIERRTREEEEGKDSHRDIGGVIVEYTTPNPLQSLLYKGFTKETINQRIAEIDRLLIRSSGKQIPTIPIFYKEASTGRYTAQGGVIQSYHKSVRYAALGGCYEYDLEAAHQNILLQLIDKELVSDIELTPQEQSSIDTIREYIKSKKQTREILAQELYTDIRTVKAILSALTYGAQLVDNKYQAIFKECGGDKQLIDRVISNQFLQSYVGAFELVYRLLVGKGKEVTNAVGITKKVTKKSKATAHLLQGYERQILDSIIKHFKRKDIALLVHDCVVFYHKQSRRELSRIVKEETGFELEFSEERY